MLNNLLRGGRGLFLVVFVLAAIAYGPLHVSMVSDSTRTPGLGRLGRDLLRRAAGEVGDACVSRSGSAS